MEQTGCSETLAFKLQGPVIKAEECTRRSEQGESLESRITLKSCVLDKNKTIM
jgi:hypothetical protein